MKARRVGVKHVNFVALPLMWCGKVEHPGGVQEPTTSLPPTSRDDLRLGRYLLMPPRHYTLTNLHDCQLRCRPRYLTMVANDEARRQKPSIS
ncbi:hypothetical protein TNCV_4567501 [Trichonephila clavipes]|nr:hypothetical protein TNCV_4567501 [Trichonephila clavipes]